MRLLLIVFAFAASAGAPPACPMLVPNVNVYINFIGDLSSCGPAQSNCLPGELISFSAQSFAYSFDCTPHEFVWNFGDGTTATGRNVSHVYLANATYTASVTIRNAQQSVTVEQIVYITGDPGPDFLASPLIVGGRRVYGGFRFEIISAFGIGEWIWDFGDGTSARGTARTQDHVYATSGWFKVKLSSAGDPSTYEQSVFVPKLQGRRRSARH